MSKKKKKTYKIYFDGSCRPINPGGVMGIGFYVEDESGDVIHSHSDFFPEHSLNTNNKAEVLAAYTALEFMFDNYKDYDNINLEFYGDSRIVCLRMNGSYDNFSGEYAEIAKNLYDFSRDSFSSVRFIWIPREDNIKADDLSTDSLCRSYPYLCEKNFGYIK